LLPNPAVDYIEIESSENGDITLCNVSGQVNLSGTLHGGYIRLDVSGLKAGLYFVTLKTTKGTVVRKMLKE
jgi:hypothetical protein